MSGANRETGLLRCDDVDGIGMTAATRGRHPVSIGRFLSYVVVWAIALVMLVPFIWSFGSALKVNSDIFSYPPVLFPPIPH